MTRRVTSARRNGSLGGKQSSRNLTEEQREQRARKAGVALLDTYGRAYYNFIGKLNKTTPPRKSAADIPAKISNSTRRLALMAAS